MAYTPPMPSRRVLSLGVAVIIATACGGQPPVSPSAPATAAAVAGEPTSAAVSPAVSGGADADALLAAALAHAGQSLGTEDPNRRAVIDAMDLRTVLGADADHILAVATAAEGAAAAKAQLKPLFAGSSRSTPGGWMVPEMAILASIPAYPPPLSDTRDYLSSSLHSIGGEGSDTAHEDTGTQTASATDGGVASSSEVRTTLDATIDGSDVKVVADRDVHVTATDSKTGDPLLDQHIRYQVTAELDVCPSAAGIVLASSGHAYTAESSTFAGAGGRVGSHNTASLTTSSTFKGQVDDQANLGNVAQDANVDGKFHRTSSAPGGPEASHEGTYDTSVSGINDGVPTSHDWSITGSDWSGIGAGIGSVKVDRTGDATVDQIGDAAGSAAVDWATIDSSFVEAQKLWRDTRCVIVTAPTYIPLSAYANNGRPTHTEEVGKGSSTEFEVGTGHRFDQKVTALIKATLDGKESLDPKEVPKPPGTLTYVASDEDDQTSIVDLISTSKRGIGRQRLLFHTSDEKLKVSITGKMTTSALGVSYTTTVSVPEILLTKQSDGSFLGSAPVSTRIHLNGDIPCPAPFKEQGGSLSLRATHPPAADPNTPSPWTITFDKTSKLTVTGSCLGISLGNMLQLGTSGATGGFMFVLGDVQIPDAGGSATVRKTVPVGASQNAIDATVKAQVIKGKGP